MDNNDVLIHWGIKGQKWGRRRFQNKDGSLTPAGKERYDDDNDSEEKIETPEERKARFIKSGSAAEVMQYQGQLSNNELRAVSERIRIENELNKVAAEQRTRGVDKFNQIMNDVDKVRGGVEKGLNAWNLIAKINNTFNEKQLPEINGKYFKSDAIKKKADEAEAKAKKDREEALRKVTPEEAAKNADKYTTAELQDLNKRYSALDGINSKVNKNASNDGDSSKSSKNDKTDKTENDKGSDTKKTGTNKNNAIDDGDTSMLGRLSRLTGKSKLDVSMEEIKYRNTDVDDREDPITYAARVTGRSKEEVQKSVKRVAEGKGSDIDDLINTQVRRAELTNDSDRARKEYNIKTTEKKQEEAAAKTRSDALKSLVSKSRAERTETKVSSLKEVQNKESISNLSDDAIRSAIARAKAGTGSSRDKDILAKYGNVVVTDVRRASGTTAAKRDAMSTRIANAMANANNKKKKKNK